MGERATKAPAPSLPAATHAARPSITPVRTALLQRACACGQLPGTGGKCDDCDKKEKGKTLQRASTGAAAPTTIPPSVNQVLSSPGRPLDTPTRTFMESRFGQDFGGVRVHDDSAAAESARAVNAKAYTVGQHIAFAEGQYQPSSSAGAALLAHELTHTAQQRGLHYSPAGMSPAISAENDPAEVEAAAAAASVMQGGRVPSPSSSAAPVIHRTPWGACPAGTKKTLNEDFGEELKARAVASGAKAAPEKKAGAFTYLAAEAAELHIAKHFKTARGRYAETNSSRLPPKQANPDSDPVQYMINEAFVYFRSGGSSKAKKKKTPATGAAPPDKPPRAVTIPVDPKAFEEGQVEESAIPGPEGAQLKPDFVDFEKAEVYDATTIDAAAAKVEKIKGYVDLYEAIRTNSDVGPIDVPKWSAGTTLPAPSVVTFGLQNPKDPIRICFGVTDFALYPGVIAYQVVDTSAAPAGATTTTADTPPDVYELVIKGQTVSINVFPAPKSTDLLNTGPQNKAVAESVNGVILKTLHRKNGGQDTIDADIETTENSKSSHKSEVPLKITAKTQVTYKVDKKTRQLTLNKSKGLKIPIKFEKLSDGEITALNFDDETGLSGEGHIKPSIPLLKDVTLHFTFAQDSLAVVGKLPGDKLKVPIPGFHVTRADVAIQLAPKFDVTGTIAFTIGTGKAALLEGVISAGVDGEGFLAKGDLIAHIPGVDEATGKVVYRPASGWVGNISITTSQIPFVQSANVNVSFNDNGLNVSGGLEIGLPGDQKVSLGIKKSTASSVVYTGKGTFNVRGLKPVVISFTYDGKNVSGTATTGFTFQGLDGNIELAYFNGVVTGVGTLKIQKPKDNPKLTGTLTVKLNKNHKFSGEGTIVYVIKPGLVAKAGIIVDDNQKVTLKGRLEFPDYIIFDAIPKNRKPIKIFTFKKKIGVPFLSFGPIGLEAQLRAGMFASYSLGPGVIKGGYIQAEFNPFEEEKDFDLEVGGTVHVPGRFGIFAYVGGGLVLDVLIAEAGGEIVLAVGAQLDAEANAKLKLRYSSKEGFTARGDMDMGLSLDLLFCLSAHAWAEAGAWKFKVSTSKTWELAKFPYHVGSIKVVTAKPISYSSVSGLELPEFKFDDGQKPAINSEGALEGAFGSTSGNKKEGGPPEKPAPKCPEIPDD